MTEYSPQDQQRALQLIRASQIGVHAQQVLLAIDHDTADKTCYATHGLSREALQVLVDHHAFLMQSDPIAVRAWIRGIPCYFSPAQHMEPLLAAPLQFDERAPVRVIESYLRNTTGANEMDAASVANILQLLLEVARDGSALQNLFNFYIALGFKVYDGQLGLPGTDTDHLRRGELLSTKMCASPFDTAPADLQIAGRKAWNWAEKKLGIRDDHVLAGELLHEPDVKAMVPAIKALPAQRIAVIGHSFTMHSHWSTPSSFTQIARTLIQSLNPSVEFTSLHGGSMNGKRCESFLEPMLAWKPDKVLLVIINRDEQDFEATARVIKALQTQAKQVYFFSPVADNPDFHPICKRLGVKRLDFHPVLDAAPDKDKFICLDGLHTTEPYHRLLAKEWLKVLIDHPDAHVA